ncbi:hypothetical protein ANRL3_02879 [Anaerolineae bacterium]|nr:hypothetical protein ANRL3_02879 [Anaerolineae bacterium]
MATPYVHERQSEYWTSRQLEEFLLDAGFEVITFPLLQYHEKIIPADFIFFARGRSKLFGFQYKALYRNAMDFWQIDSAQHQTLGNHPWIYYCLSELKRPSDFRSALHYARIVRPDLVQPGILQPVGSKFPEYSRWGGFFQGLQQCYNGIVVTSRDHLRSILRPEDNPRLLSELVAAMMDLFLADLDSRHAVHFSPQLRELTSEG